MRRLVFILLLLAPVLPGADVSGKWSGTMEKVKGGAAGPPIEQYQLTLQQSGQAISGKVGPGQGNWEIQNAKLEGSRLTFETSLAGGKWLVGFDLQLSGDELTGTMVTKKGPPVEGKLRFQRK